MHSENHLGEHEKFMELCALSISGELTSEEWEELQEHLAFCNECTGMLAQYRQVATAGMAKLASEVEETVEASEDDCSWSQTDAKRELLARLQGESTPQNIHQTPVVVRPAPVSHGLFRRATATRIYAMVILVVTSATVGGYRWGVHKGQLQATDRVSDKRESTVDLGRLLAEKNALDQRLETQSQKVDQLTETAQQEADEIKGLKDREKVSQARYETLSGQEQQDSVKVSSVSSERDHLLGRLQESEKSLNDVESELVAAREQRKQDLLRSASLEAQIQSLSARLEEQEQTVDEQQKFLASDRDIRELMGARNLYIADVFDVDDAGHTQRPFGRVFYTKGKSLIFYAFDLDQQRGIRSAAFQAWGRKGTDRTQPLNMGIFYLDNEANKRWVLKFDDPEKLAQIDSVFVTVEPHGGSKKPSGKQLLYASLRTQPNHP